MKKNILFIVLFLGLTFNISSVIAQNIPTSEKEVIQELNKRGLSENEVREVLAKKGINIDNLENVTPQQLIEIEQIIKDLEEKKKKKPIAVIPKENPKKVIIKEDTVTIVKEKPKVEKINQKSLIYGHDVLKLAPINKNDILNINEDYILGSGDEISISIWSDYSQFDYGYTIDKDGYIKIDTRGIKKRIFLQGLSFGSAKKKLTKLLSNFLVFRSGEIKISLSSSRSISISVFGEVAKPGSFNINSTNTIFEGLKYSNGISEIGSVRNIKLIKPSGKFKIFDLYKFLANPQYAKGFYLGNNDLIHVPVANKVVQIEGAIKRPAFFELLENEGLKELIDYAGGFSKEAIKNRIIVERFDVNKKVFLEIDFKSNKNIFKLKNGDKITISKISAVAQNYVSIAGAVYNPGKYQNNNNMTVFDIINKAELKPNSKKDFAIVLREIEDGTRKYITINIDSIFENRNNPIINFKLINKDELSIWSKSRYSDKSNIDIIGAVRYPGIQPYGTELSINILDAIQLAGGLTRDASNIVIIHRQDPLEKYKIQYIRIDLDLLNNLSSKKIPILQAFDKLEVLSKRLFNTRTFVSIKGAINNPGEFQYGEKMSLNDLITMSGGFKLEAARNNIEISRVVIKENAPTKVVVAKLDLSTGSSAGSFELEPYDIVIVRNVPEFELQKTVSLLGEVKYPGVYTLISKNEKISDVINRAGGFTEEAFTEGATLYRNLDITGYIILRIDEAMRSYNSKYNYVLKNEDIIKIPKKRDFVTIRGATKVDERYKDEVAFNKNGINVPFHKGKRAMFYIDNYTGGVSDIGSRNEVIVEHANGEISKTINYGLFRLFPKVREGSVIKVGYKKKKSKEDKEKEEVDWNKIITDSVAQISTIMTLVILFKSISQ